MEDMGQNPVILPPMIAGSPVARPTESPLGDLRPDKRDSARLRYATGKPTSVTVFGVLNCVFGGLGILCTPISIVGLVTPNQAMEIAPAYKIFLLVSSVAGICFSAWLLSLGIGLLKFKGWARRGSIIYACIAILWGICGLILTLLAMSMGWMGAPEGMAEPQRAGMIGGMVGGICGGIIGLLYPVLLLIFMQTNKVKQAFGAVGG